MLVLLAVAGKAHSQIQAVEQAIEYLTEQGQSDLQNLDLVQFEEQLNYLLKHPVSLNTANAEELMELPLINSFTAFNLLEYRKKNGRILTYYQLSDVKGFSPEFIKIIQPFTTLEYQYNSPIWPKSFNHEIAVRYRQYLQPSKGYLTRTYPGHHSDHYFRYRVQGERKIFAGITAQKDPGEIWLPDGKNPEFLSFHLEYRPMTKMKTLVLGDYSAEFGQGLVMWSSLSFSKNAEAVGIQRFGRGLRYYSGADENRFLRGAGTLFQFGKTEVSLWGSRNAADANLSTDQSGQTIATSLQTSGLHRTYSEIVDKKSQQIDMGGINITWKPDRLRLGSTLLYSRFQIPFKFTDRPENALRFEGNQTLHTSLDIKWLYGRIFLFGETAREWLMCAQATNLGIQIHAADGLQWVFHARSVDPGYYAPFGAFFSESGREGEKGYYLGVKIQLPSKLTVTAYADHFQYVWLRHNLNRPGSGYDYLIQANKTLHAATFYIRFRYVARPGNLSDGNQIYLTSLNPRTTVRGHGTFRISDNLNLQFRTEYVHFISPNQRQTGFLSFAGIQYDLNKNIHVKCRYTIFDTQNFATAIWAFEDDVPYGYAIPAFYGQGNRWYVVASIRCWKSAEVWIKFAETTYPVITSVGSGPDSFSGNKRNEIRIVLKATF